MTQARGFPEQLYRLLAEEAVEFAIVFFDPSGVIDHWNAGSERLFGYTAAEALGQPASLLFLPEDVRSGVPEQELQSAAESGQASDRRWKERKDRTRFFADGMVFALRRQGSLP